MLKKFLFKRFISLFLVLVLFGNFTIAYAEELISNDPPVTYTCEVSEGLSVTYSTSASWGFNTRNATVTLTNNTNEIIQNWSLTYKSSGEIRNIWNGEIYKQNGDIYLIRHKDYNRDIPAGGSVIFGYELKDGDMSIPTFTYSSTRMQIFDGFDVSLDYNANYGNSINGKITITNNTDSVFNAWDFSATKNFIAYSIWNVDIIENTEGFIKVKGNYSNIDIEIGGSRTIDFSGEKSDIPTVENAILSVVTYDDSIFNSLVVKEERMANATLVASASYVPENKLEFVWYSSLEENAPFEILASQDLAVISEENIEQETFSEVTTESVSEEITESISEETTGSVLEEITESILEVTIENVSEITTENVSEETIESISEEITENVSEVTIENVSEEITENVSEVIVENQTPIFTPIATIDGETSYIFDITEPFGEKIFKVRQTYGRNKFIESPVFTVKNINGVYTIIEPDTDGDTLPDFLESFLGLNPESDDTDIDGLSDIVEIDVTFTDPADYDSVTENVADADADSDKDNLTSVEEIQFGTNPDNNDTDGDTLTDGEEVKIYGTNPLEPDSDFDGLSDYDEILLALNPNSDITDGIKDIEHQFDREFTADDSILDFVNTADNPYQISVEITAAGNINANLQVAQSNYSEAIYNEAMLGNIPEFIYPDNLAVTEFEVKFTIDENYIQLDEDGLSRYEIFTFDEEKSSLLPVKTNYDIATDTISAKTDKLGTYAVIDLNELQYIWDLAFSENELVEETETEENVIISEIENSQIANIEPMQFKSFSYNYETETPVFT
ncbi:MAG: cellulose binding domain-containing protein [Oscillospiraceae bacterium]|jgi:hypothetical protein|nr:cellulose binding domain-containing protein [Oscillospiraceae bacterium]